MTTPNGALSLAGPNSLAIYEDLLAALHSIGEFQVEIKKTSIHLIRKTAFAGVHPRRQHLLVTIKADKPLAGPRVVKSEQVSRNRWHLDVKLAAASEIDSELMNLLREAYALCG